jgi:hypothetical protein
MRSTDDANVGGGGSGGGGGAAATGVAAASACVQPVLPLAVLKK